MALDGVSAGSHVSGCLQNVSFFSLTVKYILKFGIYQLDAGVLGKLFQEKLLEVHAGKVASREGQHFLNEK